MFTNKEHSGAVADRMEYKRFSYKYYIIRK